MEGTTGARTWASWLRAAIERGLRGEQPTPSATEATEAEGHEAVTAVQCWHTEAGSPCDWKVCRQPDRSTVGDIGTDRREQHEPTPGAIILRRVRGRGVTVLDAPEHTTMALDVFTCSDSYVSRVHDGVIEIADQVRYRVTGFDPVAQALDLVEDWRTDATVRTSQLADTLREVLGSFVHETHPGRRCLQSQHEPIATVERWRAVLNAKESP
ncbi:hypothetical protein [Streptomyces sp. NPDC056663]|uniref:hypothetical protein n=1 Tax=Streptomyces sp. NPDC056663 TaxID=3345899 RepID=UPI0036CF5B97